jgi:hypothetical protein
MGVLATAIHIANKKTRQKLRGALYGRIFYKNRISAYSGRILT